MQNFVFHLNSELGLWNAV